MIGKGQYMSSLGDPAARASIRQRIERLTPNAQRQWGRMTAHQMVCHLCDAYRLSAGERPTTEVDNLFTRSIVRLIALHTPLTWPKGVKTMPEADQEQGGTKPIGWDRDHGQLLAMIDSFTGVDGRRHPIFGALTADEWNIWGYRHADHHLRQFGV
jgi:hypothetical protein